MDKPELISEIKRLKNKHDAVLLAHNYQRTEIQEIADYLGDSLELAQIAMRCEQSVIVFCGVHFMAESAKILNPKKTVLLPEPDAGCPLADCATVEQINHKRQTHPNAVFVSYINTSAGVKAKCDVCVTSANAMKILEYFRNKEIVYLPDKNLASYAEFILQRQIIKWPGQCYVHDNLIKFEEVLNLKNNHPNALLLAHPEAPLDVLKIADLVTGTGGMLRAVSELDSEGFIVATEIGLVDRMKRQYPSKTFFEIPGAICSQMKLTTLNSVYESLMSLKPEIVVEKSISNQAKRALDRMLELS